MRERKQVTAMIMDNETRNSIAYLRKRITQCEQCRKFGFEGVVILTIVQLLYLLSSKMYQVTAAMSIIFILLLVVYVSDKMSAFYCRKLRAKLVKNS